VIVCTLLRDVRMPVVDSLSLGLAVLPGYLERPALTVGRSEEVTLARGWTEDCWLGTTPTDW
jgi:hypothetical protein